MGRRKLHAVSLTFNHFYSQCGSYNFSSNLAAKQEMATAGDNPSSSSTLMGKPRFGKPGELASIFERDTWPELSRLASDMPEAGIHFQGKRAWTGESKGGSDDAQKRNSIEELKMPGLQRRSGSLSL